ncbi:MAG: carboxymuconolactone decarboxylase family protein [Sedimentisphaerales bacterium]|nr:carboxymuconolactone decarboxylase family protein [Sedimentisphaerales bacterium]
MLDDKTKELIAIGASVSCNCHPCVKFHVDKAGKLGIDSGDIQEAIKVGIMVRSGAAGKMDELLSEVSGEPGNDVAGNCNGKQSSK